MFILELDLVDTYENFIAVIAATYIDESDSEDFEKEHFEARAGVVSDSSAGPGAGDSSSDASF